MARLRRDTQDTLTPASFQRPLRVVASGTLFVTHTLDLPSHPEPSSAVRAHSVSRSRGGSASTCLSIVAQFPNVEALLVAPLGGNDEGQMIIRDLENDRVSTRYCKLWDGSGVPSAWVLHADDTDTKTVINNNPLPDITHEEFVSLLGPVLVPENYAFNPSNPASSPPSNTSGPSSGIPRTSISNSHPPPPHKSRPGIVGLLNTPAPLDWIHFEGRSVKTTLNNLVGLDGLAREKKWRSHCVFSVDVGRRARQGVEALIPHADVLFLNKHYALAHSPNYASSPRAFLLSLTHIAPPHALLVAHWGSEGAAVLSVPTKEYFQSSGWVEPSSIPTAPISPTSPTISQVLRIPSGTDAAARGGGGGVVEVESVRSGSGFWAGAGHHTESSSEYTAGAIHQLNVSTSSDGPSTPCQPALTDYSAMPNRRNAHQRHERHRHRRRRSAEKEEVNGDEDEDEDGGSSDDSDDTQIAGGGRGSNGSGHHQHHQQHQHHNHHQQRIPNHSQHHHHHHPPPTRAPPNLQRQDSQTTSNTTTSTSTSTLGATDEVGAADAFIAGMMYALSRKMLPGEPYTPSAIRKDGGISGVPSNGNGDGGGSGGSGGGNGNGSGGGGDGERERGRWRLEECLRFATELAGRKARRKGWDGLADEMARAGWFEV